MKKILAYRHTEKLENDVTISIRLSAVSWWQLSYYHSERYSPSSATESKSHGREEDSRHKSNAWTCLPKAINIPARVFSLYICRDLATWYFWSVFSNFPYTASSKSKLVSNCQTLNWEGCVSCVQWRRFTQHDVRRKGLSVTEASWNVQVANIWGEKGEQTTSNKGNRDEDGTENKEEGEKRKERVVTWCWVDGSE